MLLYTCQYLHNNGSLCNRPCHRVEGCWEHYLSKPRRPCLVCRKPTSALPGRCKKHAGSYYTLRYYNKTCSLQTIS